LACEICGAPPPETGAVLIWRHKPDGGPCRYVEACAAHAAEAPFRLGEEPDLERCPDCAAGRAEFDAEA
jgi:hypothetical protein